MPASKPAASTSMKLSSVVISMVIPGLAFRKPSTIGGRMSRATAIGTLSLSVPVRLSRKPFTVSTAAATSPNAGTRRSSRRAPASVGVTLRVVRLRRRTPSRVSNRRTASLRVEAEVPRTVAAPRKLRCRATAVKASRSARSGSVIVRYSAQLVSVMTDYRTLDQPVFLLHRVGELPALSIWRISYAVSPPWNQRSHRLRPRPRLYGHVGPVRPGGSAREHRHHPRRARRRHHAHRHRRFLRHGPQRDADRRGNQRGAA